MSTRAISLMGELGRLERTPRVRGWMLALRARRESAQASVFFGTGRAGLASLHLTGDGFAIVAQGARPERRMLDSRSIEALLSVDPELQIEHIIEALQRFEDGLRPTLRWAV